MSKERQGNVEGEGILSGYKPQTEEAGIFLDHIRKRNEQLTRKAEYKRSLANISDSDSHYYSSNAKFNFALCVILDIITMILIITAAYSVLPFFLGGVIGFGICSASYGIASVRKNRQCKKLFKECYQIEEELEQNNRNLTDKLKNGEFLPDLEEENEISISSEYKEISESELNSEKNKDAIAIKQKETLPLLSRVENIEEPSPQKVSSLIQFFNNQK